MIGPLFLYALPPELEGLTLEMIRGLRSLALKEGRAPIPGAEVRNVGYRAPVELALSASSRPEQFRLIVANVSGATMNERLAMIFVTSDSESYVVWDLDVPVADARRLLESKGLLGRPS